MATPTTTRNQSMECAKLIAAFFVVVIHVPFPGAFGNVISCLSRFAVPMFFAISGYFSYGADSRKLARRFWHILKLNLLATALVIFCKFQGMAHWDAGVLLKLQQLMPTWDKVLRWAVLHVNPFSGELWYLTATLACYGVLWGYVRFFERREVTYRPLYLACAVLFLIRFFAGDLLRYFGAEIPFYIFRDGWFLGLPMFAMGMFLRQYQQRILSVFPLTGGKFLLLFAVSFALSFLQWEWMGKPELPLASVLQVALLILFTASHPSLGIRTGWVNALVSKFGFLSTAIYILHYRFYEYYAEQLQLPMEELLGGKEPWLRPVLIILVTLMVSFFLLLLLDGIQKLRSSFAK